jgi:hypothetical protein
MGRIRRTIIMGNPRGFVLKKFALIIATWVVVSVLVALPRPTPYSDSHFANGFFASTASGASHRSE